MASQIVNNGHFKNFEGDSTSRRKDVFSLWSDFEGDVGLCHGEIRWVAGKFVRGDVSARQKKQIRRSIKGILKNKNWVKHTEDLDFQSISYN